MRIRRISFFILLCCLCWNVFAAEYQIKGVVIDKSTRQPLEFVNVLVVGLGIGASTDANGNFSHHSGATGYLPSASFFPWV